MCELPEKLKLGPQDSVNYPISVTYCGNCSMPIEYCEYYPEYDKCKKWLEKNLPNEFAKLGVSEKKSETQEASVEDDDKKRQKRGGKGVIKPNKKKEEIEKGIKIFRSARGKKKSVTCVKGMNTFGVDLKVAAKFFGSKFACGSSVTGEDEIVIQGDVKDELYDLIPEKWPEIDEDLIEDLGDQKR